VSLNSQNFPRVDYNLGSLVFAWKQVSGGVQELAVQFTENTMIGMNPTQEIIDQNYVGGVDVSLSNGQIWVVWEDESSGTVKFKKGTYNGQANVIQKDQFTLQVVPNPSSDQWVISGDKINNNTTVELTTINGNRIENVSVYNGESIIINNTQLISGIYLATVITEKGKITLRLVKD